ncbi:MAG: DUF732 domain-containing protein [Cyanobacteria bacterium P01_E01_bin.6]
MKYLGARYQALLSRLPKTDRIDAYMIGIGTTMFVTLISGHGSYASDHAPIQDDAAGLCSMVSTQPGRWVTDGFAGMLPLDEVCTFQDDVNRDGALSDSQLRARFDEQFWQMFLQAASPEAIAFSQGVEQSAVIEYGRTICPLLNDGITMDDVRTTQRQSGLPADFDAAVNVSAIHIYCPEHDRQIGR